MNIKALLCLAILFGIARQAHCSTNITLVVGGSVTNASLSVNTGQVAKVIYAAFNSAQLKVTVGGVANVYYGYNYASSTPVVALPLPVVVGPATLALIES